LQTLDATIMWEMGVVKPFGNMNNFASRVNQDDPSCHSFILVVAMVKSCPEGGPFKAH
jgi:hypothetical protein